MSVCSIPRLALLAATALLASACGGSSTDPQAPPVIASFTASPGTVSPGGATTLSWNVAGATLLAIDQEVGEVTGTSVQVNPIATTVYTLTATNASGSTPSSPVTVTVAVGPSVLEVACAGDGCGAQSESRYSGIGIGIWRYRNATAEPKTIDVGIEIGTSGVTAELQPVLLFSNGSESASTLPAPLETPEVEMLRAALRSDADLEREARGREHWRTTERNLETFREFQAMVRDGALTGTGLELPPMAATPPVVVGDTRNWLDMTDKPLAARPVAATAQRVCDLPSANRKAAFWVADDMWDVNVKAADLEVFERMVCGAGRGYDRLVTMIGDAWGDAARLLPYQLIQDMPSRLDVHIVIADLRNANLGGYFWQCNNFRKDYRPQNCPDSNEALVVFVNAAPKFDQSWAASTILHELTHLVNFYQRSIRIDSPYDTWLEEMSAMMTEDIIVPAVAADGFSPSVPIFVGDYVKNGGGVSLMNWDGGNSYNLGATFGAFLSRRFGTAIYTGMKSCPRAWPSTSYSCLERLITASGGTSLPDEFARMGASVYGLFPATGAPGGYGIPERESGIYDLAAIDVSAYSDKMPLLASPLGDAFSATTQTYKVDTVPPGSTPYHRPGVVVPANTTLMVVIKP